MSEKKLDVGGEAVTVAARRGAIRQLSAPTARWQDVLPWVRMSGDGRDA